MSLRENLAALEHDQWIYWARGILEQESISPARRQRWQTLFTPYTNLPESTKSSDRQWADRVIDIVCQHIRNEGTNLPKFCHY